MLVDIRISLYYLDESPSEYLKKLGATKWQMSVLQTIADQVWYMNVEGLSSEVIDDIKEGKYIHASIFNSDVRSLVGYGLSASDVEEILEYRKFYTTL